MLYDFYYIIISIYFNYYIIIYYIIIDVMTLGLCAQTVYTVYSVYVYTLIRFIYKYYIIVGISRNGLVC